MTTPTPTPDAGSESHAAHAGGKLSVGEAWGYAILAIVVISAGLLSGLGAQISVLLQSLAQGINSLFQIVKMNMSAILILLATVWAIKAIKK